jgi:hypothetical protein
MIKVGNKESSYYEAKVQVNKRENIPRLSAWGAANTSKMAKARMKTNFVINLLI